MRGSVGAGVLGIEPGVERRNPCRQRMDAVQRAVFGAVEQADDVLAIRLESGLEFRGHHHPPQSKRPRTVTPELMGAKAIITLSARLGEAWPSGALLTSTLPAAL